MPAPTLESYRTISARRPDPVAAPRISIITVVLNGQATIGRTIDSVQAQKYPGIEHVVIDGGSTDGTIELLAERLRPGDFWISERDHGISDAFNKGVALARGELVQFLNADDWMSPDQVATSVESLDCTGADYVFGDLIFYEGGKPSFRYHGDSGYARSIHRRMPSINHPTALIRRSLFAQYGLFSPEYRCAMEYDFFLRIHRAGRVGCHDPAILGHMTQEGVSNLQFRRTIDEVRRISVAHGRSAAIARADASLRAFKSSSSHLVRRHSDPLYRLIRRLINPSYRPHSGGVKV